MENKKFVGVIENDEGRKVLRYSYEAFEDVEITEEIQERIRDDINKLTSKIGEKSNRLAEIETEREALQEELEDLNGKLSELEKGLPEENSEEE